MGDRQRASQQRQPTDSQTGVDFGSSIRARTVAKSTAVKTTPTWAIAARAIAARAIVWAIAARTIMRTIAACMRTNSREGESKGQKQTLQNWFQGFSFRSRMPIVWPDF